MTLSRFHRTPVFVVGLFFAELVTLAVSVTFGFASTLPGRSHSRSQNAATIGPDFKYEPISIKLLSRKATPEDRGFVADLEPDGISVRVVTLIGLLQSAYAEIDPSSSGFGLKVEQIVGVPNWANTAMYAIEGKVDQSVALELGKLSPIQQQLARAHMLKAMLADRFKLKAHPENREGTVYYLVIAKNHPKLKQAPPGETYPKSRFGEDRTGLVVMAPPDPGATKRLGLGAPMERLSVTLSAFLHCPVIDKTGLGGKYDFQLQWTAKEGADTGPEANWPSLFTAIQEQLGLKLESRKGPVPFLVIDHVEMPSGN